VPPVATEVGPTVFLPEPARLAYWRAGQAAYALGAEQPEAIRAGLAAAALLAQETSALRAAPPSAAC